MRVHLSNEVAELINDYGPQQFKNFDEVRFVLSVNHPNTNSSDTQWRILIPAASAPPSGGTSGIWRRKSSTGAVDAQGLGLTHPMTWLDERLFGWSHSGSSSGDDLSRSGTPTPTSAPEDEEGDYERVLGFIRAYEGTLERSRQSSYADLQKLRLRSSPVPPSSGAS